MSLFLLFHPRAKVLVTDAETVYIDIQVVTVEQTAFSDASEVYIQITPSAVILQVDFLLEIVGNTSRWAIDMPVQARWAIDVITSRWTKIEAVGRWAILETRRLIWRS